VDQVDLPVAFRGDVFKVLLSLAFGRIGVRSSCETAARNSSLTALAVSASRRACWARVSARSRAALSELIMSAAKVKTPSSSSPSALIVKDCAGG
jgi:hypothetical protein